MAVQLPNVASQIASQSMSTYTAQNGHSKSGLKSSHALSPVRQTVTQLLLSIKYLLASLDAWGLRKLTDEEVSDVYVRFGNDFNDAYEAFTKLQVDMSDMTSIPETLRGLLEECLSEEASPQILDEYLPRVKEILMRLLHGLRDRRSILNDH